MRKTRRWFGMFLVLVIAFHVASPAAQGNWEKQADVKTPTSDFEDTGSNDLFYWSVEAEGISASAWVSPVVARQAANSTLKKTVPACTLKKSWKWVGCGAIEAETFTLTWSGEASSTAWAATFTDSSSGYALVEMWARLESPDFGDNDGDVWQVLSKKGAECPANPVGVQRGKRTTASLTLGSGLPLPSPVVTGTLAWEWVNSRNVRGNEASNLTTISVVDACEAQHAHPGGGTNDVVDATAEHGGEAEFKILTGDSVTREVWGRANGSAFSVFTIRTD